MFPPHARVALPLEGGLFDVLDVGGEDFPEFADNLVSLVAQALDERGLDVPVVALREVVDNIVHALPCSVSVVVEPGLGNIFVSDTGGGIPRLDLAFELGYSTASDVHRAYIRGVGVGLYLAREDLRSRGGELLIASDPGSGTYVQLILSRSAPSLAPGGGGPQIRLTQRQNNILFLLSEGEHLGPSQVSAELNIGVSTAHRDLIKLQDFGLIYVNQSGKRFLSELGRSYLQSLLSL
ncbi:MAG: ATP-binding protein [Actinomycetota bacterium]|nr:ATP-binding protein [Actinomycetota bacterium]MDD5667152.1 ATP-binding protein [Actinomycetota bacterium]